MDVEVADAPVSGSVTTPRPARSPRWSARRRRCSPGCAHPGGDDPGAVPPRARAGPDRPRSSRSTWPWRRTDQAVAEAIIVATADGLDASPCSTTSSRSVPSPRPTSPTSARPSSTPRRPASLSPLAAAQRRRAGAGTRPRAQRGPARRDDGRSRPRGGPGQPVWPTGTWPKCSASSETTTRRNDDRVQVAHDRPRSKSSRTAGTRRWSTPTSGPSTSC